MTNSRCCERRVVSYLARNAVTNNNWSRGGFWYDVIVFLKRGQTRLLHYISFKKLRLKRFLWNEEQWQMISTGLVIKSPGFESWLWCDFDHRITTFGKVYLWQKLVLNSKWEVTDIFYMLHTKDIHLGLANPCMKLWLAGVPSNQTVHSSGVDKLYQFRQVVDNLCVATETVCS